MANLLGIKLNKWQLALIIGTPLLIGTTVYIYKKSRNTDDKDKVARAVEAADKTKERKGLADKQTISLDGTANDKALEQNKKNLELEDGKMSPLKEATMYKNEGNTCFRSGKYDEAINFYDKAIAKCPVENRTDLAIFYQNRAAAYEMLKKWKSVKEDCSNSLEYNPRYAKAYFRRAKAHEATKDIRECLDDITATCILEMFQNNNTILFADRVLKQTGREDAEAAMKDRVAVLPSNTFIRTYLRSFVSDPLQTFKIPENAKSAPSGFIRAKIALDEGRYDEIISGCNDEIAQSESESHYKSEALLMRGTFHLLSGAFQESKKDLDAVIENNSASNHLRVYAFLKRASLHVQLDDKDKCFADFDEAQSLQPENPDIYHQRAQVYILLDQLQEALQQFEQAVKLAPNHAMAFIQKLYAEYRVSLMSGDQMRLMMVMNEFKNSVEKFPDCVECYSLMAQVLSDQQQFAQADQYYEKALKMAPGNASLYVHRAIMMLQWKGDIDKAISLMNRALEVDEKCELAYETMGTIEVQRANLDRAVELFEKAIRLAKSQGEISHLYSLRNAALAQINVTRKLGIDMASIAALNNGGVVPA